MHRIAHLGFKVAIVLLFLCPAFACFGQKEDAQRYPQTKTRKLTAEEVKGWDEAKIRYAINEIYARHGVDFPDKGIKKWFQHFTWYKPEEGLGYDDAKLTDIESANVTVLEQAGGDLPVHYDEDIPAGQSAAAGVAEKKRVASAVITGKDKDDGDVRLNFADGHSVVATHGGHCLMPHVSTKGDAGWVFGGLIGPPPASRRVGKDVLVVRLADGTEKKFETGAFAFIEQWHFVEHGTAVVIKSRDNHGPSGIVEYSLKTGRAIGHASGNDAWEQMPEWARGLGDD